MKRYQMLVGGLLAVAAAVCVWTFSRTENKAGAPAAGAPAGSLSKPAERQASAERSGGRSGGAGVAKKRAAARAAARASGGGQPASEAASKEQAAPAAEDPAAEKAVEAWESLVDALAELKDVPTHERMTSVKEAFDALAKKDQMDAIHTALNLVPDEQFTALYAILFDKHESEEVLDAIFSDALNRSEDIKVPLIKELAKDKTHPMYFESARILDATGELEQMPGDADKAGKETPQAEGQGAEK